MHLCDVPDEIERLLEWLATRGFEKVEESAVNEINGELVFTDGVARVHVGCDRCEWDVSIGVTDDFRHPDVWEAYL